VPWVSTIPGEDATHLRRRQYPPRAPDPGGGIFGSRASIQVVAGDIEARLGRRAAVRRAPPRPVAARTQGRPVKGRASGARRSWRTRPTRHGDRRRAGPRRPGPVSALCVRTVANVGARVVGPQPADLHERLHAGRRLFRRPRHVTSWPTSIRSRRIGAGAGVDVRDERLIDDAARELGRTRRAPADQSDSGGGDALSDRAQRHIRQRPVRAEYGPASSLPMPRASPLDARHRGCGAGSGAWAW
jgi:hypothetical protein